MLSLKSESLIQPKRLKLEIKLDETVQTDESNSIDQNQNCDNKLSDDSYKSSEKPLQEEIDELKNTIATIEKYEHRKSELLGLITKWQEAGQKALEELQEKIEPKQDMKVILDHFQIDPGLFNMQLSEEI